MKDAEKLPNPSAVFWQQFGVMEESWGKVWDQILASPAYAQAMGSFMDLYLSNQQLVNTQLKKLMTELNLPTKQDLAVLAQQIGQLEVKVIEMQRSLDELNSKKKKTKSEVGKAQ